MLTTQTLVVLLYFVAIITATGPVGKLYEMPYETQPCESDGLIWYQCTDGYGIANGTDKGMNCCPNHYACPAGFQECTQSGACCQSGFGVYCPGNGSPYCCQDGYYCGTSGGCYQGGSCQCTGCLVNPCIGIGCGDCEKCCNAYIGSGLCQGWQCSAGYPGSPNVGATLLCTTAQGAQGERCDSEIYPFSQPYCCPVSTPTCANKDNTGFVFQGVCCEGQGSVCGGGTAYASCCKLPTYSQCCANTGGHGCCQQNATCCGLGSGCCCDSYHPVCCNVPEFPSDCSTAWCCAEDQECGTSQGSCVSSFSNFETFGVPASGSSSFDDITNAPVSLPQSPCCSSYECYGNYCGRPGNCDSAEYDTPQTTPGLPLCDNVDAVCQTHDNCYDQSPQNTCCCDKALVASMNQLYSDGSYGTWTCPLPPCHSPSVFTYEASVLFGHKACTCNGVDQRDGDPCSSCSSSFIDYWINEMLLASDRYIKVNGINPYA